MQTAEPWDADADAENADADSDAVAVDDAVAKVDAVAEDDDDLKVIFAWRGHRTVCVSDRKGTIRSGERPLKMTKRTINNIINIISPCRALEIDHFSFFDFSSIHEHFDVGQLYLMPLFKVILQPVPNFC